MATTPTCPLCNRHALVGLIDLVTEGLASQGRACRLCASALRDGRPFPTVVAFTADHRHTDT